MKDRSDALDLILAVNASIQRNNYSKFSKKIKEINLSFYEKMSKKKMNKKKKKMIEVEKQKKIKFEEAKLSLLNDMTAWNTNSKAIKFELTRSKIKYMAQNKGLSIG